MQEALLDFGVGESVAQLGVLRSPASYVTAPTSNVVDTSARIPGLLVKV